MSAKLKRLPERYQPGFLRELDGRTEISQRLNAVYDRIVADCGGSNSLSHTKLALIERFVFLEATLQTWEHAIATDATGSEKLPSRWVQGVNSLQGLARLIGLDRQSPRVVDLQTYVKERHA